jgi:hypothetical protein
MPLGKITPLERTPEEQRVWDRVSKLKYPEDKATLKRLPRHDFRVWLAAVDPLAALLLDNYDREFYDMLRYQNRKGWLTEAVDAVWRMIYARKVSR